MLSVKARDILRSFAAGNGARQVVEELLIAWRSSRESGVHYLSQPCDCPIAAQSSNHPTGGSWNQNLCTRQTLNPNISRTIWDISIFSLFVCRGSPTLSPNRAIILFTLMVESPLKEDTQYFLSGNTPGTEFLTRGFAVSYLYDNYQYTYHTSKKAWKLGISQIFVIPHLAKFSE